MLPINSALNPVLYTLTTQLFKQQLARIVYTWRAGGVPVECQHESSGISMTSAPYNGRWSKNSVQERKLAGQKHQPDSPHFCQQPDISPLQLAPSPLAYIVYENSCF
ncbi:uncharacterized protein CEXT_436031 [Caerostris extrusa]|uniref:G-protein coupled receptors family 1 profile domain-containing protein n=1 Tax=Caerostris extrusa TaxID=172846 RepID=A0AAV4MLC9_CAEEX|nr:uncharacterized protein CEXT_436031 [Caerostris extrusa]